MALNSENGNEFLNWLTCGLSSSMSSVQSKTDESGSSASGTGTTVSSMGGTSIMSSEAEPVSGKRVRLPAARGMIPALSATTTSLVPSTMCLAGISAL